MAGIIDNLYINAGLGVVRKNGVPTTQIQSNGGRFGNITDSFMLLKSSFEKTDVIATRRPLTDFNIPTCSIDVKSSQTVIKTKVFGLQGTIKEYITPDDYQITVTGVLLPTMDDIKKGQRTPMNQAILLDTFANAGITLNVKCKHLQQTFNIQSLIIDNYNINRKLPTSWEFSIYCTSDVSINLEKFKKG